MTEGRWFKRLKDDGLKLVKKCKDVSLFYAWSFLAQAITNPKFVRFHDLDFVRRPSDEWVLRFSINLSVFVRGELLNPFGLLRKCLGVNIRLRRMRYDGKKERIIYQSN